MARVKRGVVARKQHKKVLKAAKGYYNARRKVYRVAYQAVTKAAQYAYRDRRVRKREFRALWIVMALGYTYSGITKLVSTSWVDGQAFAYILANPLAHDGMARALLLGLPPTVLQCLTWGALLTEIATAPLACSARVRPWLWAALTALQVGLLVLLDFADLTAGMLVLHIATFDPRWLRRMPWRATDRSRAESARG